MSWIEKGTRQLENASIDQFLDAVTVWFRKPHVVNRRLRGADILWSDVLYTDVNSDVIVTSLQCKIKNISEATADSVKDIFRCHMSDLGRWASDSVSSPAEAAREENGRNVMLRCLIPKQNTRYSKNLDFVVVGMWYVVA